MSPRLIAQEEKEKPNLVPAPGLEPGQRFPPEGF